ncbi:hypothetical protein [Sulfurimonas sp. HSL-1716]|uniref:hypothetical protein n=1 Tax=Hydrocurvibacter sulfurireducens TaxID=3131937 RepID=UPI0031F8CDEC
MKYLFAKLSLLALLATLFTACASKAVVVVPIDKSSKFAYANGDTKPKMQPLAEEPIKKQNKADAVNQPWQSAKLQKDVDKLEANKDYKGLKEYTDNHPQAVYYIKDEPLKLAMIGPKGLKVGDIREYLKNGKSELILLSMIKQQESPYKKFTLHEIDLLEKMGLTDKVIAAMIDVTTLLLHDEKIRKQQNYFLEEQKRIAASQHTAAVYQTTQNQTQQKPDEPDETTEKVKNEVIKQGVGILLDQLFHR